MNFSSPVPSADGDLVDIAHHFLEALRLQAGGVVRAVHGAVQGQVALDDAGAHRGGHGGDGNAALVTGVAHRHARSGAAGP